MSDQTPAVQRPAFRYQSTNALSLSRSEIDGSQPSSSYTHVILASVGLLKVLRPDYWDRMTTNSAIRLLKPREIAELQGIFGDSLGWGLLFGLLLLLAVPYLAWGTHREGSDSRWLVPMLSSWYFLILIAVQGRFAGQLGIIFSLFAGLGFVHLAERVEVARVPRPFTGGGCSPITQPTKQEVGALLVLFLLVGSLSFV